MAFLQMLVVLVALVTDEQQKAKGSSHRDNFGEISTFLKHSKSELFVFGTLFAHFWLLKE